MRSRSSSEKRRKWEARRRRGLRRMQGRETVRLTVYRSAKHIYAQLVDPVTGRTLVTASSRAAKGSGESAEAGRIEAARRVGKTIAELARERGIAHVVFNRNGFLYHGRVKALGEAAREAGLNF